MNWKTQTEALKHSKTGLKIVDNLLEYISDTAGQPSKGEKALFAGSVVFAYGVWENYVEQLAIELVEGVAPAVKPEFILEPIKKKLEKRTAWELTVAPGWRKLWVDQVKKSALGNEKSFGMNTARSVQVKLLLESAGVVEPLKSISPSIIPLHIAGSVTCPTDAIDALVTLRGEIVHTGKPPNTLRKQHVKEWREFTEALMKNVDKCCRDQCKQLLSKE
jgi:hypothetical protein